MKLTVPTGLQTYRKNGKKSKIRLGLDRQAD